MSPEAPPAGEDPESGKRPAEGGSIDQDLSQRDRLFQKALRPIIQASLLEAFQTHSHTMIESLYPLVGRAVRRSVGESLKALADSIDTSMRNALTFKRLRWRLQAKRQGIPVAELILRQALLFRVEEAFAIHRETGLMIRHAGQRGGEGRDLVSGMFTAIQDFVADSFRTDVEREDEPERLNRFQAGEHDVWLMHGPLAYLAVVISGEAPVSLRENFNTVLEGIHERFGRELKSFKGDSEPFTEVSLWLEDCLVERQREPVKRSPVLFQLAAVVVLAAMAFGAWQWWRQRQVHQQVLNQLKSVPGVVVTKESGGWRRSRFEVLTDPSAKASVDELKASFQDRCQIEVKAFLSLEPQAIRNRVQGQWQAFATARDDFYVELDDDQSLRVKGEVTDRWLTRVEKEAVTLGVPVTFDAVVNRDRVAFQKLGGPLESLPVEFLPGQWKVGEGESLKWHRLAQQMQAMLGLAEARGFAVAFTLYALPRSTGEVAVQQGEFALARARAEHALTRLHGQGVPLEVLTAHGLLPDAAKVGLPRIQKAGSVVVVPSFLSLSGDN